jgi:hypothetical protein
VPKPAAVPRRRRRSALFRRLDETAIDRNRLEEPGELRVAPDESSEAKLVTAYCPVLRTSTGYGQCRDVDCGRCPHLYDMLTDEHPDYTWVCSNCTDGLKMLPFWADGSCESCGYESAVLMLAVPL